MLHGVSKGAQEVCQGAFGSILVPILNILGPNIGEYGIEKSFRTVPPTLYLRSCVLDVLLVARLQSRVMIKGAGGRGRSP